MRSGNVELHSRDGLYLMPDESTTEPFFVESATTEDDLGDTSDDVVLPPSSSSPLEFASSPYSSPEGRISSKTSVLSTPPAFFSPRVGQYLVSEEICKSPDEFARRLKASLEHAVASQGSASADLKTILGSGQRWLSTLEETACGSLLDLPCAIEQETFSSVSSPGTSKLDFANPYLTFEISSDRSDARNVTVAEPDPGFFRTVATNFQDFPDAPNSGQETEISPIMFCYHPGSQRSARGEHPFRIIKHAKHYVPPATEDDTERERKRKKVQHPCCSDHTRRIYANRNASARRADSLRSVDCGSPNQFEGGINPNSHITAAGKTYQKKIPSRLGLKMAVPIIAPPADHVTGITINPETLAKFRLNRYLERERDLRMADGVSTDPLLYLGSQAICQADTLKDSEQNIRLRSQRLWEVALGIGEEKRLKAIDWILNVLPARSAPSEASESGSSQTTPNSPLSSCTSTTSSAVDIDRRVPVIQNLYDQLQTSCETRFHACWIFLRFFYLTMSAGPHLGLRMSGRSASRSVSVNSQASTCTEHEGRDLIVWDVAVACLSLSVKLHRDFLDPLLPVYSQEYLAVSPHRMSYDDLECAHRDILSKLGYRLGSSPQLLMDELWFALPSLRNLLDFEGGWEAVMCSAWSYLFGAIREPDVTTFSVSLLTTVAIMDGVVEVLTDRGSQRDKHLLVILPDERDETEGVLCDIQSLVGLTDAQLRECRLWKQNREAKLSQ